MFGMLGQMMALTNHLMGDMESTIMGEDGAAHLDVGRLGGGSTQMMMMTSGGDGQGFMMRSVRSFDPSDPSAAYERTQTAQFGPGGVVEARERVRDGWRGVENLGLRRQLGDRYAQTERTRHLATGEESTRSTVHNVPDDDVDRFDDEWMAAASRTLPTYRRAASQPLLGPPASRPLGLPAPPEPASTRSFRRSHRHHHHHHTPEPAADHQGHHHDPHPSRSHLSRRHTPHGPLRTTAPTADGPHGSVHAPPSSMASHSRRALHEPASF